ncbi:MAG: hypothetical protein ACOY0T_07430 [Myxococcota bacterium]
MSRALRSLLLASLVAQAALAREALAADEAGAPAAPVTTAAANEPLRFAVVVGNNKSLGRRRPELRYADDDAARYYEIFQTIAPGRVTLLAEFDRDTERLFSDANGKAIGPTRKNLELTGQRVAEQVRAATAAGRESELYFVFAGHGDVAQGEGFIEMSDERFRSRDLSAWLKSIPFTRAHVILDSCNSFFMLGVRKPGGRHFATSEDAARSLAARLPNVGVFLSTSADGEAFEWSEIQSGIFSHVVRSGLLGGADANGDGSVSYLELAGFVHTATADVKNPNMRPHVFARGPGARDDVPIANLQSMTGVRRFQLSDSAALRLRLRNADGLPLIDAHSERAAKLELALPEAWARGSVVERSRPESGLPGVRYGVPEQAELVTLAALEPLEARSAGRGPDETFQALFQRPYGAGALAEYRRIEQQRPPAVFGVSRVDTQRMALVLDQIAATERGARLSGAVGSIGFGTLVAGAGIGVLHVDSEASSGEKTQARVLGGVLTGFGGLLVLGSTGAFFGLSTGEEAALEFRTTIQQGKDPSQAFARADERIRELIKAQRAERIAEVAFGSATLAVCATGLTLGEIAAEGGGNRMGRRLGWGTGIVAGAMMLGDALLVKTNVDALSKIWRDDPSLNQYQPSIVVGQNGGFLSLSGAF